MALDVFYKDDILNLIISAATVENDAVGLATEIMGQAGGGGAIPMTPAEIMALHRRGFMLALHAVADGFGLRATALKMQAEIQQLEARLRGARTPLPAGPGEEGGGLQELDMISFLWEKNR